MKAKPQINSLFFLVFNFNFCSFIFILIILFQPQGPQDAKEHTRGFTQRKHNKTHAQPRTYLRQLPRPNTYKT